MNRIWIIGLSVLMLLACKPKERTKIVYKDRPDNPPGEGNPGDGGNGSADGGNGSADGGGETNPVVSTRHACPWAVDKQLRDSEIDYSCYSLSVPADYEDPDGKRIAVEALLISGSGGTPLVVEQGGPGGSSMSLAARYWKELTDAGQTNLPDLVAVEQRGTEYTDHFLQCEVDYTLMDCIERNAHRVDFITTANIARDNFHGSLALTGKAPDFFGVSYGTAVGQHMGRLFGDRMTHIVLDSSVDLGRDWNAGEEAAREALQYLSQVCGPAGICESNPEEPDLVGKAEQVMEKFPEQGYPVGDTGKVFHATNFQQFVFQAMYSVSLAETNVTVINLFYGLVVTGTMQAEALTDLMDSLLVSGMSTPQPKPVQYFRLYCSEFSDRQEPTNGQPDYCAPFPESGLSVGDLTFDTPTLILGGRLDPVTPPAWGKKIEEQLPQASMLIADNASHGVFTNEPCMMAQVLQFLRNELNAFDPGCGKDMSLLKKPEEETEGANLVQAGPAIPRWDPVRPRLR